MTPNPSAWAPQGRTFERVHGGPDSEGAPSHDFSTNSNACGPCPSALAAVARADASTYPDASYTQLRQQLADFHAVAVQRVVLAASASEFIFRITVMAVQRGVQAVSLPPHSYGDYAQAARAHQLPVLADSTGTCLHWSCEPSSPLGDAHEGLSALVDGSAAGGIVVLDSAYEPLRLSGALALSAAQLQKVWQLWTPNKALGLTGVRAAYAVAPQGADADIEAMNQLCPSWPIGAHGVAMLQAWTQADTQAWLASTLDTLRDLKAQQVALCTSFGWTVLPSQANFFVCRWGQDSSALAQLRGHGIKLRDCASFGLTGHVRLSVQAPAARDALQAALQQLAEGTT
jgi:histidinol-phosphate aminotransferase